MPLPPDYNSSVMGVKRKFAEEVKHRTAERQHSLSLTTSQRYVLRELGLLFRATDDEDRKAEINLLERAFRGPITTAVNRELNLLRRNGVTGESLFRSLTRLYNQHNMRDWLDRRGPQVVDEEVPRIVCSEGLV